MAKSRDNKATIISPSLTQLSFNGQILASEGQPCGTPQCSLKGNTWLIELGCGRHGTAAVAQQFNSWSGDNGDGSHEFGIATEGDVTPQLLNFAFGLNCVFTLCGEDIPVTIYLGQGHNINGNNWWIGSHNMSYPISGSTLTVTNSKGVQTAFRVGRASFSVFDFGIIDLSNPSEQQLLVEESIKNS